jgi:TetR/AcrR family transcriptional regulator
MVDIMPASRSGATAERLRDNAADTTRRSLLAAARAAFAEGGLKGARVDDIARRADVNKQLVYHYFGSKDGLYTAVLEQVYREIRDQEAALALDALPPEDAMRRLVEFSFDYLLKSPDFVRLLADENAQNGRHLQGSTVVEAVNRPIIAVIRKTLQRGASEGKFRADLDPLQVYLSIAGMSFFFFANMHTLSRAFDHELNTQAGLARRRAHIVDFTLNAIRAR